MMTCREQEKKDDRSIKKHDMSEFGNNDQALDYHRSTLQVTTNSTLFAMCDHEHFSIQGSKRCLDLKQFWR